MTKGEARAALCRRLSERREEVEQTALTRLSSISDLDEVADPAYVAGLRAALEAAVDYGLAAIECGEERTPDVPQALLTQARLAARSDVGLDTVLRRYVAGYALLYDYVIEEADRIGLDAHTLRSLHRSHVSLFDRLLAAVAAEHNREMTRSWASPAQRRLDVVRGLLAGELLDTSVIAYDFDGMHLGLVAGRAELAEALPELAVRHDWRLLLVHPDERTVWAWMGTRRRLDPSELTPLFAAELPSGEELAVGEPAQGLNGWRLTHRQAAAAMPIAQRRRETVRYADVALLAAALRDDLLATSLRGLYLNPLGSEEARRTLRAYFAAGRNVSSAAATLGVNRNTVTNRLRAAEDALGRPLESCATDLDLALRLEELVATPGEGSAPKSGPPH